MAHEDLSGRLRALPAVDTLLRTETARALSGLMGAEHLATLARAVTEEMRRNLQDQSGDRKQDGDSGVREALLAEAAERLERAYRLDKARGLRRVINASGVILHTNLGRAPLSVAARRAVAEEASRYCTLEYELETGQRGRRGARVETLLTQLTGAEDALVVNNCAAAALLILTVIAKGGEAIVSRGELVEIGGDFRIPEVMAESGTRLVEVGATNRTRLSDYQRALTEQTRLLMRVHPSNYRIVGFTATPTLAELAGLAHDATIPLYEDAGSGALFDLSQCGLEGEPVISQSISSGADLVSFSGDKLLGGAQAGLIVGRHDLIQRLRRAPLYRALRADKLALAALEATLESHQRGTSVSDIPVLRMLSLSSAELSERAQNFLARLSQVGGQSPLQAEIIEGRSAIGGGAAPTTHPPTTLVALSHITLSVDALDRTLRQGSPPVIARISDGKVLIDLRTVMEDEESELLETLLALSSEEHS